MFQTGARGGMDGVELMLMTAIGLDVCRNLSVTFALLSSEVVSVSQVQKDLIS